VLPVSIHCDKKRSVRVANAGFDRASVSTVYFVMKNSYLWADGNLSRKEPNCRASIVDEYDQPVFKIQ
jgi:hypothetical protein